MPAQDSDVVVVGAGVAGCAAAQALAPDHDVHVVDRRGVAAEATGLSAGIVAPSMFYGDIPAAARHANGFFREFDGTGQFSFTERHRLDLMTADEAADARETAATRADDGFPVSYLDASAVGDRFPSVDTDGFAGAVYYEDTGWVDPYTYATALAGDAEANGATVETGVTATGLLVEDGRVAGVETDDGPRRVDSVVVAAGWRTRDLVEKHCRVAVRPYRTQVVVLEPDDALPDDFPLMRIGSRELYLRPEHNGDLLVGGWHEIPDDPAGASRSADEAFRTSVARTIPTLLDGFERAGVVNDWAGVDGGTADSRPIVDRPADGPDGLVVATGFNGLGVMASPIAAAAVRALVSGEDAPFPLDAFRADRFGDVGEEFDITYTSDV